MLRQKETECVMKKELFCNFQLSCESFCWRKQTRVSKIRMIYEYVRAFPSTYVRTYCTGTKSRVGQTTAFSREK